MIQLLSYPLKLNIENRNVDTWKSKRPFGQSFDKHSFCIWEVFFSEGVEGHCVKITVSRASEYDTGTWQRSIIEDQAQLYKYQPEIPRENLILLNEKQQIHMHQLTQDPAKSPDTI